MLGVREDDVVFSAAKLFFAYGLGNALTFPLSAGATTVLMAERPTPQAVFKRLAERKPTIFCGVPTLYAAMLAAPELPARADVRAAPLRVRGRAAAEGQSASASPRGSAATCSTASARPRCCTSSCRTAPGEVRYGTTGTPVPGYDVELRGEDGAPGAPTARSATSTSAARARR